MLRATTTTLAGSAQAADLVATGTDQASAAQMVTDIARVKTGSGGIQLPPAKAGADCMVVNKLAGALNIYPDTMTERINALALGAPLAAATLTGNCFICYDDGFWVTFASAIPTVLSEAEQKAQDEAAAAAAAPAPVAA